jgi:hypothetical protein
MIDLKTLDDAELKNLMALCEEERDARRRVYVAGVAQFSTLTAALDYVIAHAEAAKKYEGGPEKYFSGVSYDFGRSMIELHVEYK